MSVKELFDFVTDPTISDNNIDEYLDKMQEIVLARNSSSHGVSAQQQVDDEVFKQVHIPRTLEEVVSYEEDYDKMQEGLKTDISYQTVIGLKPDLTGPQDVPVILQDSGENLSTSRAVDKSVAIASSANTGNITSKVDALDLDESDSSDSECSDSGSSDSDQQKQMSSRRAKRNLDPSEKKAHKLAVKEQNKERRKNKVPKHIKKRKEKIKLQGKGKK